jgi:membrane-associated PAP2 superfamily phosphatase
MLLSLIVFRRNKIVNEYKKGLIVVILSAIFVPVVIGGLKAVTNTPCPKNTVIYGGIYPEVKVLESYPKNFHQKGKIKCWPAGHASGGFALLSLFFLFKSPRNKKRAVILSMVVGWSMGLYKMTIGDHYLSHTLVTMFLAWIIILIIARIVKPEDFTQI